MSTEKDFKKVTTNKFGNYDISLNFDTLGKYSIQSTWNGYQNFSGSDSRKLVVNIGLNYILDQYETNETVNVGSEYIQIPTLGPVGSRILGNQPIKTILKEDFIKKDIIFYTEFVILGNNEKYPTDHLNTQT